MKAKATEFHRKGTLKSTEIERRDREMADIMRWDPFREVADLRETMDRLFDRGVSRPWRLMTWDTGEGFFPVDLYETDDDVVVKASLPGVRPEEVQISVTGDTLSIKAETKEEHEEKTPNYYRKERHYGAMQRVLTLPVRVNADQANAEFDTGVLTLRLPKAPEVRAKTIEVKPKGVIEGKTS
jgi:HSP20 family protein